MHQNKMQGKERKNRAETVLFFGEIQNLFFLKRAEHIPAMVPRPNIYLFQRSGLFIGTTSYG